MKKRVLSMLALWLAVVLVLTGCGFLDLGYTSFSQMEYSRPDIGALRAAAEKVEKQAQEQNSVEALMNCVYDFYGLYNDFYTDYALADIRYCKDLTDIYWEEEYQYCMEAAAQVDALLDQMLYTLADCPLRKELEQDAFFGAGFFDDFQGESIWTEEFTALMEQEAQLQSRYYELCNQAQAVTYYSEEYFSVYGSQMADLFVQLVALRQEIAKTAGYDDYLTFAYDFYYDRDYTPQQAQQIFVEIEAQLVPLYLQTADSDVWELGNKTSFEAETFRYVKNSAKAMGGTVWEAFSLLEKAKLYDIAYARNKYDASFEVYLTSYAEPYVFVNPSLTVYDQLTFAHEFGHFCNDYASYGSMAGIDVAEIFSQGMEYLSLCYGENTGDLQKLKMADCLGTYVEQSAYASFEQQVYMLSEEALTAENIHTLYEKTGKAYGFDTWNWDSRSYVCVTHYFTNPMYIISYVVSNDAALQLYQLEKETSGAGLALYEKNLATQEGQFLAFVESADLQSPFVPDRMADVRKLLEDALK